MSGRNTEIAGLVLLTPTGPTLRNSAAVGWARLTLHQDAAARGTTLLLCALTSGFAKKEERMDREHMKGAAGKVKGASKGTAGKVRDDKKLQGKGKSDKSKGLPENSNLHINEEDKKRWETTVGGT